MDRDLTGQRFGELTVLEATDERIGGGVVWLCRCSCGAICKVSRNNLVTGQTRSCGHAKRRDLTGQRFGRLVAVRPIRWRSKAQPCSVAWLCKCDCGSVAIAALGNLTKGLEIVLRLYSPPPRPRARNLPRMRGDVCHQYGRQAHPAVLPNLRPEVCGAKLEGVSDLSDPVPGSGKRQDSHMLKGMFRCVEGHYT